MNAKQLQQILLDAGYTFQKTHNYTTEKSIWSVVDDDLIPIASGHYLGEVIFKASEALGELN